MSNWMPKREAIIFMLCRKWLTILACTMLRTKYRWDNDLCDSALSKIEPFTEAYTAFEESDTSVNRTAKNQTKQEAVKAMRMFATTSVRNNPFMTDADRLELGLRKTDSTSTSHLRPTSRPTTAIERTLNYFEHRVKALNVDTGKAIKPADAYGVHFVWQVGGEKPATGGAILKGRFSRKPVITIAYDETERGKTAYYASCYENAKGEAGPWSPIVDAFIG